MDTRTVIDLTGEEDNEPKTKRGSTTSSSRQESANRANGPSESGSVQQKPSKARRRYRKPKDTSSQPVDAVEDEPKANIPLAQRIQGIQVNGNKASNALSNNAPKRKRRESVDSTNVAQLNADAARPPPPKRLKSGGDPSPSSNKDEYVSTGQRKQKNAIQEGKSSGNARQAPSTSASKESDDIPKASKPPSKVVSRNRRASESPKPDFNSRPANGKRSRKGTPRARSASVPTSEILFFVDTKPNKEYKHEEVAPKPAFKIVSGNLLLPEHVLLENAEEATIIPGTETYPPPSPVPSQGSIDLIHDNARVRLLESILLVILTVSRVLGGIGNRRLAQRSKNVASVASSILQSSASGPLWYVLDIARVSRTKIQ